MLLSTKGFNELLCCCSRASLTFNPAREPQHPRLCSLRLPFPWPSASLQLGQWCSPCLHSIPMSCLKNFVHHMTSPHPCNLDDSPHHSLYHPVLLQALAAKSVLDVPQRASQKTKVSGNNNNNNMHLKLSSFIKKEQPNDNYDE